MKLTPNSPQSSPLGKESQYPDRYAPELLFAISRAEGRAVLNLPVPLPFYGVDNWTGYEISWLNHKGKPQVALGAFSVPCESPNLIESKSFKLYLNSLNQEIFDSKQEVEKVISTDLEHCAGTPVGVRLLELDAVQFSDQAQQAFHLIDDLDVAINEYAPNAALLKTTAGSGEEQLVSHLLKSNCPVTGQPDWGSLFIDYAGPRIEHESLLQYVVSYRNHMGFHEQCVEQIFMDLMRECRPERLTVCARYLRRGGLDINPIRSTSPNPVDIARQIRQ